MAAAGPNTCSAWIGLATPLGKNSSEFSVSSASRCQRRRRRRRRRRRHRRRRRRRRRRRYKS